MPTHTVKEGEHLSRIARLAGFRDYRAVWEHPQNAQLRQKRKNPHILFPGDKVFVPDKQEKEDSAATNQRHRYRAQEPVLMLRLVLKGLDGTPVANAACELRVAGETFQLQTDGQGRLAQRIPVSAESGSLKCQEKGLELQLKIGHLHPVDEQSGWIARLNNLGYQAGDPARPDEAQVRSAVEEFQCDHRLTVDGKCGPNTQTKLREIHGC